MQPPTRTQTRGGQSALGPIVAMLLLTSACSTSGTRPAEPVEASTTREPRTVEKVRVDSSVRADFDRALALLKQQDYEGGIEALREVTEAAPHVGTAHVNLAIAYGRTGDLERARASAGRALELDPSDLAAHNELGIIYRKLGRFDDARASYEKALVLNPAYHFARRNLAILCELYLADLDCALGHYERYSREVPDDESVVMWIADLRSRIGR